MATKNHQWITTVDSGTIANGGNGASHCRHQGSTMNTNVVISMVITALFNGVTLLEIAFKSDGTIFVITTNALIFIAIVIIDVNKVRIYGDNGAIFVKFQSTMATVAIISTMATKTPSSLYGDF